MSNRSSFCRQTSYSALALALQVQILPSRPSKGAEAGSQWASRFGRCAHQIQRPTHIGPSISKAFANSPRRVSHEPLPVGQEPARPYAWFRIEAGEVIFAQGDWPPPEPDDTAWLPLYTVAARSKFDLAFDIMRQMQAENMDTMQSVHFGYVLRVERGASRDASSVEQWPKSKAGEAPFCNCISVTGKCAGWDEAINHGCCCRQDTESRG